MEEKQNNGQSPSIWGSMQDLTSRSFSDHENGWGITPGLHRRILSMISRQLGPQSPRKQLVTHYAVKDWNPAGSARPPCSIKHIYNTIQIKLGWALFVTYTIIQSIMRSEMCSLHLTHPSVHTWSSGQPTVLPREQSWTSCRSQDSNPQPWVTSGFKPNALSIRPTTAHNLQLVWNLPMIQRRTDGELRRLFDDTDIKLVNISSDRRYWIGTVRFSQALFLYLNCIWQKCQQLSCMSSDCIPMTGMHILNDKTVCLAYRMYYECPVALK